MFHVLSSNTILCLFFQCLVSRELDEFNQNKVPNTLERLFFIRTFTISNSILVSQNLDRNLIIMTIKFLIIKLVSDTFNQKIIKLKKKKNLTYKSITTSYGVCIETIFT